MAEDYHAYFQRKADERAAARADARTAAAAGTSAPSAPSPTDETRGTGTLTKYRPVGGWRDPGAAQTAPNLAELGEPTSFAGGAGAPEPIEVIRGMKRTYAPAGQSDEYGTRLQAAQAYNRVAKGRELAEIGGLPVSPETKDFFTQEAEKRYGSYRAPGQTLAEIAAEREGPETGKLRALQTRGLERQETEALGTESIARFNKWYEGQYGKYDSSGVLIKPTGENEIRDLRAAQEVAKSQGDVAARKYYQDSLMVRQYEPVVTGANLQYMQSKVPGQKVPTSAELAIIKQSPDAWRRTVLHYGPYLKQLGSAPMPSLWEGIEYQGGP
jgi:hypothetical protein